MPPETTTRPRIIRSRIRPIWLNIRVSPGEREFFHRIAAANGSTVAELVRLSLLTEAVRLGISPAEQHQQQELPA